MTTVLLTDPEQRAALAAARSLGRAGHRVFTIGATPGLAGRSRAVLRHMPATADETSRSDAFVTAVARTVREVQADVVVPVSDFASRSLLSRDDDVGAHVAGPSREAYERASDKARLLELAAQCGVRVPRQAVVSERGQAVPDAVHAWGALVIKPTRSEIEVNGKSSKVGVRFVDGIGQLAPAMAAYPAEAFPLLLQERTMGDGVGVFLLRMNGETPLAFGHRRLHEKPPAGGVSTYREAVSVPPALLASCEQLLDRLEYSGAAMLEFKRDHVTGEYVLMEINARLWGSLQLAIDAGVDFPVALVALATGEPLPPRTAPRVGVRSVWEFGELDHALALARRSREALHLPPDVNVGWRAALAALFERSAHDHREVFRWSDPAPFFAEALRWIRRA